MKTYVVLFRGINVGGRNLVPMKELVVALEESNFQKIRTYIQSGNVVLQSQKKPDDIASIVQDRFGFGPEVFVFEESEFNAAMESNPFRSVHGKDIHFYFCKDTPKLDAVKLKRYQSESEEYRLKDRVFYLYAPDGIGRSKLVANLESCLGVPATGRNLNTLLKLHQMAQHV